MTDQHHGDTVAGIRPAEQEIREDIAFLETKLASMALEDDCAYQKLLIKAYRERLSERKRQLALAFNA
jgi:hypothetical protein